MPPTAIMTHAQATEALQSIGAAWAVTDQKVRLPNDAPDGRASYHVHSDAAYPHERHIRRFFTLTEVAHYIEARRLAAADISRAEVIMQAFNESLA